VLLQRSCPSTGRPVSSEHSFAIIAQHEKVRALCPVAAARPLSGTCPRNSLTPVLVSESRRLWQLVKKSAAAVMAVEAVDAAAVVPVKRDAAAAVVTVEAVDAAAVVPVKRDAAAAVVTVEAVDAAAVVPVEAVGRAGEGRCGQTRQRSHRARDK
jgi:hypothetical protein